MATANRRRSGSTARRSTRTKPRSVRAGRLTVVVASPDGGRVPSRGLAAWLQRAAPASARGEVTVALISNARMRTLNRAFRGKDVATDVLSFPVDSGNFLGDIAIATGIAARQAKEAGHPVTTEVRVLALHGLLHLLGYDHEKDDGEMNRAETRLRRAAGLKAGLTERGRKPRSRTR